MDNRRRSSTNPVLAVNGGNRGRVASASANANSHRMLGIDVASSHGRTKIAERIEATTRKQEIQDENKPPTLDSRISHSSPSSSSSQRESTFKSTNSEDRLSPRDTMAPPKVKFVATDAPNMKIPSCVGLPPGWDVVHDRCIAYLTTHAPLTKSGKIPAHEASIERYTTQEISEFLVNRFPQFNHLKKVPHWAIEKRLQMLELRDNEYFGVAYGAYRFEDWGQGI